MPKLLEAVARSLLFAFVSLAPVAAVALCACDAGGDQPPVYDCTTSSDCPDGLVCEFPVPGGCGAQGQCGAPPASTCATEAVCACDGTTINACAVGGYSTSAASSVGACGPEGGAGDAEGTVPEAGSDSGGG